MIELLAKEGGQKRCTPLGLPTFKKGHVPNLHWNKEVFNSATENKTQNYKFNTVVILKNL